MRTKVFKTSGTNHASNKLNVKFQSLSRSDSNGPVEFGEISHEIKTGERSRIEYKKSKPYFTAGSYNSLGSLPDGIAPSAVDYRLLHFVLKFDSDELDILYPRTAAVNFAMLNAIETGNLLLGVSLAESKKTQKMVAQSFITFYNFVFDLYKAGKKLNVFDLYDTLSNAWLEARYGWRPLLGEITAMYDLLTKAATPVLLSKFGLQSFPGIFHDVPIDNLQMVVEDETRISRHFAFTGTLTIENLNHRVGFNYVHQLESRNDSLLAQLGLDLESIDSTVVDLIPFSFLLNMFTKHGSLMQAETFSSDVRPFNGYHTKQVDYKVSGILRIGQQQFSSLVSRTLGMSYTMTDTTLTRMEKQVRKLWAKAQLVDEDNIPIHEQSAWIWRGSTIPVSQWTVPSNLLSFTNSRYGTNHESFTFNFPSRPPGKEGLVYLADLPFYWSNDQNERTEDLYTYTKPRCTLPIHYSVINKYMIPYDAVGGGEALLHEVSWAYHVYTLSAENPLSSRDWKFLFRPDINPNVLISGEWYNSPFDFSDEPALIRKARFYYHPDGLNNIEHEDHTYFKYRVQPLDQVLSANLNYTSSGSSMNRELFDDFVYHQLLSAELSAAQYTDLAIFAERLTTAIMSSKKS